ncbi:MAG: DNA-3-methyladenine glycosylase [Candidatus Yonathbacteria bacterium]|nr:DNA-3-methyladenine glycosylase [Candidatus Yonathbacteria bacterium]
MRKVLSEKFFARSTLAVAEELLGKFLVRKYGEREEAHMITEVEAYDGHLDRASHASRGKTERNEPMWGPPGRFYVYLIYGMHEMLNIVTGRRGYPAAVLIRGVEGFRGPGILTKALRINRTLNNKKADKKTGLWIEDRGVKIPSRDIKKSPRVGVHYAGPVWSKKPYRFFLKG